MNTTTRLETFVSILSINLVHRFPDLSTLDEVDVNTIKRLCTFLIHVTDVVDETWREETRSRSTLRRERSAA